MLANALRLNRNDLFPNCSKETEVHPVFLRERVGILLHQKDRLDLQFLEQPVLNLLLDHQREAPPHQDLVTLIAF